MRYLSPAILLPLLMAACTAAPALSLFQKVQRLAPDGTLVALSANDFSPFQQFLYFHPPAAATQSILALELDYPEGDGTEGAYLALYRSPASTELRYFEQADHSPRAICYFHRNLSAAEIAQVDNFLKSHPLAQLAATPSPATQPASAPATAELATATADESTLARLRITDAQLKQTRTLTVDSPTKESPPAQLLTLLLQFRETGTLACNYLQSIPPSARMLFSDPHRQVLQVWTKGQDIRAIISAPPQPESQPEPADAPPNWFTLQNGHWNPSAPPPSPPALATSQDAVATAPAEPTPESTVAVIPQSTPDPAAPPSPLAPTAAAPQPLIFQNPGLLPAAECWWTQSGPNYTTVWHYVPFSPFSGVTLGFVVPSFHFDEDHMAVDSEHETLYLIHQGQLFSLPIPKRAMRPQ